MNRTLGTDISLEARHTPDETVAERDEYGRELRAKSGFVEIGAVIEGVFVPLVRRKAGGILTDIERARERGDEEARLGSPVEPRSGITPGQPGELEALRARVAELQAAQGEQDTSATTDTQT